jgi:hypothetical protein
MSFEETMCSRSQQNAIVEYVTDTEGLFHTIAELRRVDSLTWRCH